MLFQKKNFFTTAMSNNGAAVPVSTANVDIFNQETILL